MLIINFLINILLLRPLRYFSTMIASCLLSETGKLKANAQGLYLLE